MSNEINKDIEKVNKGRKKGPVKEKASLRDQLQKQLLNKARDMDLGQKVCSMWLRGTSDRQEWLNNQLDFLADIDEFVNIEPQGLFRSSSNLHIPVSLWTAKAYHARMLQTLLNPDPQFSMKARVSAFSDSADDIHQFMRFTLMDWANNRKGVEEALDQWVWSWITTGIGYKKWRWDTQWRRYRDIETIVVEGPSKIILDEEGNEVSVPTSKLEEREVVKEEKVFDGPCCEFRPIEDILVVGRDMTDVESADAVIDRDYFTASDLFSLVDQGIFDADAVDIVIKAGNDRESQGAGGELKQERAFNAGDTSIDSEYKLDRYEILETYIKVDIDGSGINSDIILWVHNGTGEILRATYLHRVNKKGLIPIIPVLFHKRSGVNNHLPVGLVEMMHPIAKEMDAMHNMRVDFGIISNMPFGFYRSSSSLDPKAISLEPGMLIPVDNPQTDINFPSFSNRTVFGLQEESSLMTMLERLTGISDLSLGAMSGKQGATRTATGSRLVAGELSANLDVPLKRLNRGWKLSLEYLLSLLQLKTPKGMEFRATGARGLEEYIKLIDLNDLKGDFDIEVSPTSQESNKMLQIQRADQVLMHMQDPIAIQMGIVTPQNYYEALKNKFKTLGIKEVHRFLNAEFNNQVTLTPEEEVQRLMVGMDVKVMPNSDHEGFLALAAQVLETGELSEAQEAVIQGQIQQHQTMAAAVEQAKRQQANMQQMKFNAGQGASIGESNNEL